MVCATRKVAPVSDCTSGMSTSMRSRSRSAARSSRAARASGLVRLQAGKASAAADAAASTCAAEASGAWPTVVSVAGLTMS